MLRSEILWSLILTNNCYYNWLLKQKLKKRLFTAFSREIKTFGEEVSVTCGVINSEEIPLDPKVFVFGL